MEDIRDFAFFVVHFGYTKADYDALTPAERAVIMKAYEDKTVSETTLLRDAVLNAVGNALRKKGKPFRKLWRKKAHTATREEKRNIKDIMKQIQAADKTDKGWLAFVQKLNNRKGNKNG